MIVWKKMFLQKYQYRGFQVFTPKTILLKNGLLRPKRLLVVILFGGDACDTLFMKKYFFENTNSDGFHMDLKSIFHTITMV